MVSPFLDDHRLTCFFINQDVFSVFATFFTICLTGQSGKNVSFFLPKHLLFLRSFFVVFFIIDGVKMKIDSLLTSDQKRSAFSNISSSFAREHILWKMI